MGMDLTWQAILVALVYLVILFAFMAHFLLRRHREQVSRLAWMILLSVAPLLGMDAYVLLGDTNIGVASVIACGTSC